MSRCLPNLHKCEMPNLGPFVQFLNRTERRHYVLDKCLDVKASQRPQPEALFVDSTGGSSTSLVIEHKCVEWPRGAIERHRIEHDFTDEIRQALRGLLCAGLWDVELWPLPKASKKQRSRWVQQLRDKVARSTQLLASGGAISGGMPFAFRLSQVRCGHPDYEEGKQGIEFSFWPAPAQTNDSWGPRAVPRAGLRRQIARFLQSTRKKFHGYEECRRVLLLEAFFALEYYGDSDDVAAAAQDLRLPSWVDEMWHCEWLSFDLEEQDLPQYTRIL